MRRKHVVFVVRPEDEVRVFHHVYREEVEDEIQNNDFDETIADKLGLGEIALISASTDRWYRAHVDFVSVGDLGWDCRPREGCDGPVPTF